MPIESITEINSELTPLLSTEKLRFKLDYTRTVEATFQVHCGTIVKLSGPSGAGKTTLLRALARLHPRLSGEILLDGVKCETIPPPQWRRAVSYLSQKPVMLPGSVRDNLRFPCILKVSRACKFDEESAVELMKRLKIPSDFIERDAALLSGGEQSRIALIRTLLAGSRVILADEITAPLDDECASSVVNLLVELVKESGLSVLLVAHQPKRWEQAIDREISVSEMVERTS